MARAGETAFMGDEYSFRVVKVYENAISFGARGCVGKGKGRANARLYLDLLPKLCLYSGKRFGYKIRPGIGDDRWCVVDPGVQGRGKGTGKVLEQNNRAILEMQSWHLWPFKRATRDIELLASGAFRFLLPPGLKTIDGIPLVPPSLYVKPRVTSEKRVYPGLDLRALQTAGVARSVDPTGFDHPLDAWSCLEWGGATSGELGEACNIAKKLLRIRKGTRGNVKQADKSEASLVRKLATEMADVVNYLVIWAASEGIDLSDECERVFNEKSKQIGYGFQF